jgi:hypothetical protein
MINWCIGKIAINYNTRLVLKNYCMH